MSVPPGSPAPALQPIYELEPAPERPPRRRQLANALYRQRWLGLALLVFFLLAGASLSWWLRPYYEATGSLMITTPSLHPTELTPVAYQAAPDPDREMETELTVLGSRAVAMPVIRQLQLEQRDPEIAAAEQKTRQGLAHRRQGLDPSLADDIAVGVFGSQLKFAPVKLSSTVQLSFGSRNAALAAAVVNATAQQFLAQLLAARQAAGEEATHWMRQQVADARQALAQDNQAVEAFQQAHAYTPLQSPGGAQSELLDRLSDANHALAATKVERIANQAAVASYKGGVLAALPPDLRNPAIERAANDVGAAASQLAALETTYKPDFPLVVEARQQLTSAQKALDGQQQQVVAGLDLQLASSQQKESQMQQLVEALSRQAAAASGIEMRFGVLQAEAAAQRELVAALQQKEAELELQATLPPSNVQLLDRAVTPVAPSYPKLPLDLGLGLVAGLVVGLGAALMRERWSEQLTATEAVKAGLGPALAPLGMVAEHRVAAAPARALLPAAEAAAADPFGYQKIAANLVGRAGPPPRAILITSANEGEGKTTSVCQLGLALAQSGWRTLVVDCDLTRPGCHAFFGLAPAAQGLAAAEAGRKVAPIAVAPHLDLMPAEVAASGPLQARPMAALLEQWREHYDYILLDSPPARVAGAAVTLSALVEAVVVVLRWGRTRLPEAQQVCEELARAHAPLVGTLFNRADQGAPSFRAYQRRPARLA
ncbi:MAG: GumC family protein [Terriglobales bacterium]